MVLLRKTLNIVLALCVAMSIQAEAWRTHYAYNNVTQIALGSDVVYALSDGSLFSVNKQTEAVKVYNRQSGLHGTGITCIHYDALGSQLIIGYNNGQIDVLTADGVTYIGDLYDKDMTQRKTINNVTIKGRTAYLSTPYGIQTMDLREHKLVDSYWLRPGGQETDVKDVLLTNDSIYAFTDDSLFCAKLTDDIVDYRVWKREKSGRVAPDAEKGVHYQDGREHWYRGYAEGVIRITLSERITYKPNGPLVNTPYRMRATSNRLGVVQGGYVISSYKRPGMVMLYDNGTWRNYDTSYLLERTGLSVTDISDILFDPADPHHFFASSFGYGLFEFRADTLYKHHNPSNSLLEPVIAGGTYPYIWVDGLTFDAQGDLWMLNNSYDGIKVLHRDGTWSAISNEACHNLDRTKDLLISRRNPNVKFVSSIRNGIGVFDENRAVLVSDFTDAQGQSHIIARISAFYLTTTGILLVGTESGLYRIDAPEAFLDGDKTCLRAGFDSEHIRCITEDTDGHIWIGTQTEGVYCFSADLTEELNHLWSENSPLPSNDVLSLCWMNAKLFIGTTDGLIEYDPNGHGEGLNGSEDEGISELEEGSMLQWKLHFCYSDPREIAATPSRIYAVANGALFSVDREDESIEYWNKSTGLNGNTVAHIAYDATGQKLLITYEDGRIDLLSESGKVTQMPDLYMKAGSLSISINCVTVGARYAYIGTNFGIIAIDTKKAEVSDTYYIGPDASSVDVQQLIAWQDTLYAFSNNKLYKAALQDNLVDFAFWKAETLPCEKVQQAVVYQDHLYALQHDTLYVRTSAEIWTPVRPEALQWISSNDGKLLVYRQGGGLYRLTDDGSLEGLTNQYALNTALYTNGEYWAAEGYFGLIRLDTQGDHYFHTEGPNSNFGYCMYAAQGQMYSAIGGRWAGPYWRPGRINIYDGASWRKISEWEIDNAIGSYPLDFVSIAVDAADKSHFFAASYGMGVYEFRDYKAVKHYTTSNSTLREIVEGANPATDTYVDGAMMDAEGNLWVLNATQVGYPLHILTSYGQWIPMRLYSNGQNQNLTTPTGIWTDQRNPNRKWFLCQRSDPRVIVLDDGGTPTYSGDDRCMVRNTFVDQNGNTLMPAFYRSFAQDKTGRIWIGTEKGLILLPADVDFFSSNACKRIIIPRNDGTGLGDYLLGDEQINCLAVDSGNRMWIGTANSGLYLIEDDTITVVHFTETNSLLPSNNVQSIAIMPETGEVFVGTDKGIASYRSDASEAKADMSGAYAFPNPVRPEYGGYISITGLMDNTVVNIIDAGGNLVCKTRSHGGTAVWDGKLPDGRRATPGVYTALCNAEKGHAAVKILVIR